MIDVFIVACLALVLVAGSVRIAIEIYLRRQARAARQRESVPSPMTADAPLPGSITRATPEPIAEPAAVPVILRDAGQVASSAEPSAEPSAGEPAPADGPPVALFSVEMGASNPRLCIAAGGRTIPVEIRPWQTVGLSRALIAAGTACASGAQPPPEGTVFS